MDKHLRHVKLHQLMAIEGYSTVDQLLEAFACDSVCPAICMEAFCKHTEELEPDQEEGYCEVCGGQTMVSALVLAGVI